MTSRLLEKYAGPVPRYTSYPTAPHFGPLPDKDTYGAWLQELEPGQALSLYLHVPFCRQMCWYCGCHTKISLQDSPIAEYARALQSEIRTLVKALPGRFRVSHIHWGGGTPSILSGEDFTAIMSLLHQHFQITDDAEMAVEMDPRRADPDKIRAIATSGINRASLGVQDFNPRVQAAINRIQSFEVTRDVVDSLRANGIQRVNLDLMYGLPLQTADHVRETVRLSHKLRPDRIALFGYAHVPWMKSHMKMIHDADLPDGEARLEQAQTAADMLLELGYRPIGLDHFAHPDDPLSRALADGALQRNFQGYTTDGAETLIGLGASAIGKLPQGYVQNTVSIADYKRQVTNNGFAVVRGVAVSTDDKLRREVIERLMCDLTVDLAEILSRYDKPADFFAEESARLDSFQRDGLVSVNGTRITVSEQGRFLVRTICAVFDTYLGQGTGKHSRAV
jgi:oxygen-independent coproporphyrinogen-3 oxidase